MTVEWESRLVAGRECGSCNVCCVALTIDDPSLQKVQGYRCRHTLPDHRCGIYESRPQTCRSFNCGWRQLKWVQAPLRPDRSGVLVRLHIDATEPDERERASVVFMLLTRVSLKAEGLAESVAAAVAAGIPTYLNVPGPPGYTSAIARINDVLQDAVLTRNKAEVLNILRRARAAGVGGDCEPVRLARQDGC